MLTREQKKTLTTNEEKLNQNVILMVNLENMQPNLVIIIIFYGI